MTDKILSSLCSAPAGYFVYSTFGFYGRRCGGELPGSWFVRALGPLGQDEFKVRQCLYRLEAQKELQARKAGRTKLYRATPFATASIEAGTSKIFAAPLEDWDGQWTVAHFHFGQALRVERDRVREILEIEGFAPLGPGVFVHPRDRSERIRRAVAGMGVAERLFVFRGRRLDQRSDRELVRELWDLGALASGYQAFLRKFEPLLAARRATGSTALGLRFAMVFDYLQVAWKDPELPQRLLPAGWPGWRARSVTRQLYRRLLPAATKYADEILRQTWPAAAGRRPV